MTARPAYDQLTAAFDTAIDLVVTRGMASDGDGARAAACCGT